MMCNTYNCDKNCTDNTNYQNSIINITYYFGGLVKNV